MCNVEVNGVNFDEMVEIVKAEVLFPVQSDDMVDWMEELRVDGAYVAMLLELCGRTCYKSEERITPGSADGFIRGIVKSRHESVIEHYSLTAKFICDRATSHQLVRHRIGAYSQESQRYCDYGKENKLKVILPEIIDRTDESKYLPWAESVLTAYLAYKTLRDGGVKPEDARSLLPNAVKTEVVATYNLRQWRHVFRERACNRKAQGQIRFLMTVVLKEFIRCLPAVFFDFDIRNDEAIYISQSDN